MEDMFHRTPFNGDISGWDVSSVTNMEDMFHNTPFNGDISGWDVSSVTNMAYMFHETSFDGDIFGCKIQDSCFTNSMFDNCPIQEEHRPTGGNSNHVGDY